MTGKFSCVFGRRTCASIGRIQKGELILWPKGHDVSNFVVMTVSRGIVCSQSTLTLFLVGRIDCLIWAIKDRLLGKTSVNVPRAVKAGMAGSPGGGEMTPRAGDMSPRLVDRIGGDLLPANTTIIHLNIISNTPSMRPTMSDKCVRFLGKWRQNRILPFAKSRQMHLTSPFMKTRGDHNSSADVPPLPSLLLLHDPTLPTSLLHCLTGLVSPLFLYNSASHPLPYPDTCLLWRGWWRESGTWPRGSRPLLPPAGRCAPWRCRRTGSCCPRRASASGVSTARAYVVHSTKQHTLLLVCNKEAYQPTGGAVILMDEGRGRTSGRLPQWERHQRDSHM